MNRLGVTHECDRLTDGQMDRRSHSKLRCAANQPFYLGHSDWLRLPVCRSSNHGRCETSVQMWRHTWRVSRRPCESNVSWNCGTCIAETITDLYKVPDVVSPIHAVSSHVATDNDPSKFLSIFSDNLQVTTNRNSRKESTWHAIGRYRLFQ